MPIKVPVDEYQNLSPEHVCIEEDEQGQNRDKDKEGGEKIVERYLKILYSVGY
jgi:hypothetical protein